MKPNIARLEMIRRALPKWNIKPIEIKPIHYGENAVFRVRSHEGNYIACLSGAGLHLPESVRGEVRFIEHRAAKKIKVARPLRTNEGEEICLTENLDLSVATNSERIITLFEKAEGRRITQREMTEDFVFGWGAYIGRMHEATKNFKQTKRAYRPAWYEVKFQGSPLIGKLAKTNWFKNEWKLCEKRLYNLLLEDYGLIHADPRDGNFKVHNKEICLFDFDDSCVMWRVYDLTVVFLRFTNRIKDEGWIKSRKKVLLEGYRSVRPLNETWEKRIESFIRARWLWILAWLEIRQHVPRLQGVHERIYRFVEERTKNGAEELI